MKYLKHKLITYLAKNLLPVVEPREIIAFANGKAFINKREITGEELSLLKIEAEQWQSTRLYRLVNDYFAELVQKKMFIEGTDVTDLVFGKSCLYSLNVQKTIYDSLKNAKKEVKL
ncbi:MAG: hypothetical protein NT043_00020 [Candidatus Bathyarchaeota archaeon]|nr:hypothetical protein [Candidatus Bathyarchaeota archaeon]